MTTLEPVHTTIIRVSSTSPVPATAGSIAATLRQSGSATVQAIGAGAVNQAVKALAVAAQYLVENSLTLSCVPSFVATEIDGAEKTAMRFEVTATDVFTDLHGGHHDVTLDVDGEQVRMLADPNMSEETKEALRNLYRAAKQQVTAAD